MAYTYLTYFTYLTYLTFSHSRSFIILYSLMPILPIVTGADSPILRTKTKPVKTVTKEILQLLKDMEETTVHAKGAGIAAPQVNRSERVCIVMLRPSLLTPLINPQILWKSTETDVMEEGCLSLPEVWLNIRRPTSIVLKYQDLAGKTRELKLEGWDARVVQHEVDNLDGVLILDHAETGHAGAALM